MIRFKKMHIISTWRHAAPAPELEAKGGQDKV